MQTPDTLAKLATRLEHYAAMSDAFGPTEEGHVMRLAAAVITELETTVTQQLQSLEAELDRITRERANFA